MFKKIVWLWFSTKWKDARNIKKYINDLVLSWANEFFTWYNPKYWNEKFWFEVSPNWRFSEHEQITDFDTLKQIVEEVQSHKLEIFVNLNAWYYTDITMPYIEKMVNEFIEIWFDWIICWNISILEHLKNINYKWKINISTILAIYNNESIKFFLENYKINKIILSRELTLKEIEEIVLEFPQVNFEVFWEWDFCRYNNWLCFAEHKYWSKDICTIVVNDLIIKKRFKPDFKKIILDDSLDNIWKVDLLNNDYSGIFEEISNILEKISITSPSIPLTSPLTPLLQGEEDNYDLKKDLLKIIIKNKNRVDLFFDALKPLNDKRNKNIVIFLRWVKYLLDSDFKPQKNKFKLKKEDLVILTNLNNELEQSIKSWLNYLVKKTKELWWWTKLKALELWNFYSRNDNLNLYSYLFFSKFNNIETIKFPTRWRSYNEKLKLIEEVILNKNIDKKYLDRWINIERAHYDLSYLFDNELWFREVLNNLKNEKSTKR